MVGAVCTSRRLSRESAVCCSVIRPGSGPASRSISASVRRTRVALGAGALVLAGCLRPTAPPSAAARCEGVGEPPCAREADGDMSGAGVSCARVLERWRSHVGSGVGREVRVAKRGFRSVLRTGRQCEFRSANSEVYALCAGHFVQGGTLCRAAWLPGAGSIRFLHSFVAQETTRSCLPHRQVVRIFIL